MERYDKGKRIGENHLATVYQFVDIKHRSKVSGMVIKDHVAENVGWDQVWEEVLRYYRDFQHEYVVTPLDTVKAQHLIIMELMSGSLRDAVERSGVSAVDLVRKAMCRSLEALKELHLKGLIHGDIRPEQLLFSGEGRFRLSFSIGLKPGGVVVPRNQLNQYVAPELLNPRAGVAGPGVDLFSLGMTGYELLVGADKFRTLIPGVGENSPNAEQQWLRFNADLDSSLPPLQGHFKKAPEDLCRVIDGFIKKRPSQRMSIDEALQLLSKNTSNDDIVLRGEEVQAAKSNGDKVSKRSGAHATVVDVSAKKTGAIVTEVSEEGNFLTGGAVDHGVAETHQGFADGAEAVGRKPGPDYGSGAAGNRVKQLNDRELREAGATRLVGGSGAGNVNENPNDPVRPHSSRFIVAAALLLLLAIGGGVSYAFRGVIFPQPTPLVPQVFRGTVLPTDCKVIFEGEALTVKNDGKWEIEVSGDSIKENYQLMVEREFHQSVPRTLEEADQSQEINVRLNPIVTLVPEYLRIRDLKPIADQGDRNGQYLLAFGDREDIPIVVHDSRSNTEKSYSYKRAELAQSGYRLDLTDHFKLETGPDPPPSLVNRMIRLVFPDSIQLSDIIEITRDGAAIPLSGTEFPVQIPPQGLVLIAGKAKGCKAFSSEVSADSDQPFEIQLTRDQSLATIKLASESGTEIPGVRLRVNGKQVPVRQGEFTIDFLRQPSAELQIEADGFQGINTAFSRSDLLDLKDRIVLQRALSTTPKMRTYSFELQKEIDRADVLEFSVNGERVSNIPSSGNISIELEESIEAVRIRVRVPDYETFAESLLAADLHKLRSPYPIVLKKSNGFSPVKSHEELFAEGMAWFERQEWQKAADSLNRAKLRAGPDANPEYHAYYGRALFQQNLGNVFTMDRDRPQILTEFRSAFEKAEKANVNSRPTRKEWAQWYRWRAEVYRDARQVEAADEDETKAKELEK